MSSREFLLLRRGGGLWALPGDAVRTIHRDALGLRVTTTHAAVHAEEVIGLVRQLAVRPAGRLLTHLWPQPCAGLAVVRGVPVVVVDAESPPRALHDEGVSAHAE